MATAYLFPGQGSQSVGMGKDHFANNDIFAKYVDRANEVLGFDLKQIMFEGPANKLKQVEYSKRAIFLHSIDIYNSVRAVPDIVDFIRFGDIKLFLSLYHLQYS